MLDVLSASLLGDLFSHSLLVDTTEDNSPGDLSGVLSLQEEGLLLGGDESVVVGSKGGGGVSRRIRGGVRRGDDGRTGRSWSPNGCKAFPVVVNAALAHLVYIVQSKVCTFPG